MTLYINPMQRASRRRSLDEIMQDWDQDYRGALTFPIDVKAESDAFTPPGRCKHSDRQ